MLARYHSKHFIKMFHYTPRRRLSGEEVQLLLILDVGTRRVSGQRPRFIPPEMTLGNHCRGGWVGPRAGLDAETIRKIFSPLRGSNLDRPVNQPVARHYTDLAALSQSDTLQPTQSKFLVWLWKAESSHLTNTVALNLPISLLTCILLLAPLCQDCT
jgi:hypothetical protein